MRSTAHVLHPHLVRYYGCELHRVRCTHIVLYCTRAAPAPRAVLRLRAAPRALHTHCTLLHTCCTCTSCGTTAASCTACVAHTLHSTAHVLHPHLVRYYGCELHRVRCTHIALYCTRAAPAPRAVLRLRAAPRALHTHCTLLHTCCTRTSCGTTAASCTACVAHTLYTAAHVLHPHLVRYYGCELHRVRCTHIVHCCTRAAPAPRAVLRLRAAPRALHTHCTLLHTCCTRTSCGTTAASCTACVAHTLYTAAHVLHPHLVRYYGCELHRVRSTHIVHCCTRAAPAPRAVLRLRAAPRALHTHCTLLHTCCTRTSCGTTAASCTACVAHTLHSTAHVLHPHLVRYYGCELHRVRCTHIALYCTRAAPAPRAVLRLRAAPRALHTHCTLLHTCCTRTSCGTTAASCTACVAHTLHSTAHVLHPHLVRYYGCELHRVRCTHIALYCTRAAPAPRAVLRLRAAPRALQHIAHSTAHVLHPHLVRYYGCELHRVRCTHIVLYCTRAAPAPRAVLRLRAAPRALHTHCTLLHTCCIRTSCGTTAEEMLLFMELCVEGSLEALLGASGALDEPAVRRYTKQLLSAVQELHSRGIAHRDIKSGNIFLTNEGHCLKLGDFGCAVKIRSNSTVPGELQGFVGTQAYMAPEVFMKSSGHGRGADIWSLGCVVAEMASGKRPFSEYDSNYQIMFVVGMGGRPEIPASLSEEGQEFCRRCLTHDPELRPRAHDLALHHFLMLKSDEDCKCEPAYLIT
ncbi:unnamed protein product [Parnassius apollo]|uniref:(apollo) hypothetical protein n=1 Tax=Parnassius apollo TaxID=110799 RepID=A0A8S3XML8_PARAO|nr:unnamed protein product [Parnassius apollo]